MFLRAGVFSGVFAVALLANGGALAANQTVMALQGPNRFVQKDVTVSVGETVTWTNGGGSHNVVFDDGSFTEPASATGPGSAWPVSRTFTTAGVFSYYCVIHGGPGGQGMSGTVTVVAPGGNPPPSGPPQNSPPTSNPPGGGGPPASGPKAKKKALGVTLKLSDARPFEGERVRVFGTVKPARDGRRASVQKRLRSGKFKTIGTAKLKHSSGGKSTFSLRMRVTGDVVLRVKVAGDSQRASGVSETKRIRVARA
jgi:plastocyanin